MGDFVGKFLYECEAVAEEADVLNCDVVALDLLHFQGLFLENHFFGGAVVMIYQLIDFRVQVRYDKLDVLAFFDCLLIIFPSDTLKKPAHAYPLVDEFAE